MKGMAIMKYKKLLKLSLGIVIIVLFAVFLQPFSFLANTPLEKQNSEMENLWPVNENGQTYGPDIYNAPPGAHPDLMAAIGIDDTSGYVLYSDLEGPLPRTPEEAVKMNDDPPRYIPLYDKDGKTVIGTFIVGK